MTTTYHSKFKRDIQKIKDKKLKKSLLNKIQEMKDVSNVENISGAKKLSGHSRAYRIRIGNYRLGFYNFDGILQLKRFVKRDDTYKIFP
ncbi:MAG TPA: plasmid stabilization protein [Salinimicrobium sp.]|nr:plasmid stabilization protein [Salinimicrobium sp.]